MNCGKGVQSQIVGGDGKENYEVVGGVSTNLRGGGWCRWVKSTIKLHLITSAEREVKDSRRSGMYQS